MVDNYDRISGRVDGGKVESDLFTRHFVVFLERGVSLEAQFDEGFADVSLELKHVHGLADDEPLPHILAVLFAQVDGDFLGDKGRCVDQIFDQIEILVG